MKDISSSIICNLPQVNKDIQLDQFKHTVEFHDSYITDDYDIKYPGIIMKITFKRNIGYHILQTFVPSTLFVMLGLLLSMHDAGIEKSFNNDFL